MHVKGIAQIVDQIALVGFRHLVTARGDEHEGRRTRLHLGHVAWLDALALNAWRRMALNRVAQPAVQISRLHACGPILIDLDHGWHQPVRMPTSQTGQEHDGCTASIRHQPVGKIPDMFGGFIRLFHRVPFGNDQHDAAAFAQGEVGNQQVLFFHRLVCVHDEGNDICIFQRADRLASRHAFKALLHLVLAAQASGINQADAAAFPFPVNRDGVARDAGFGTGQQAVRL